MSSINSLQIDSQGNSWIDDSNQGIFEYGPAGNFLLQKSDTGNSSDRFAGLGIAVGPGNDIFFTDRLASRVLRFRQAAPAPALGKTAAPTAATGTVLVKVPGSGQFKPLDTTSGVPIGSTLDTSRGAVVAPVRTQQHGRHPGRDVLEGPVHDQAEQLESRAGASPSCS